MGSMDSGCTARPGKMVGIGGSDGIRAHRVRFDSVHCAQWLLLVGAILMSHSVTRECSQTGISIIYSRLVCATLSILLCYATCSRLPQRQGQAPSRTSLAPHRDKTMSFHDSFFHDIPLHSFYIYYKCKSTKTLAMNIKVHKHELKNHCKKYITLPTPFRKDPVVAIVNPFHSIEQSVNLNPRILADCNQTNLSKNRKWVYSIGHIPVADRWLMRVGRS